MITKEDNLKDLSCALLDCGYLDLDFLVNLVNTIDNTKFKIKGEDNFLFTLKDEGKTFQNAVYEIRNNFGIDKIEVNSLIETILRAIANRINEIYSIELEEGTDYEIFTNWMDSYLILTKYTMEEDFINTDGENEISKSEQEEIKKIFEEFN